MKKEQECARCGAPNGRGRRWCFDCGAPVFDLQIDIEVGNRVIYAVALTLGVIAIVLVLCSLGGCSAPFTAEFSEPSSAGSAGVAGYPITMPQGGAGAGAGTSSGGAPSVAGGGSSAGANAQAGEPASAPMPCARDAWTASAFVPGALQGETPSSAIDESLVSRWSSGVPQAPGQWFAVDLGAPERLVAIRLHAAAAGDMPAAVLLELDGISVPVKLTAHPGVLELDFPVVMATRLRLVLDQSSSAWWSLTDLEAVCE